MHRDETGLMPAKPNAHTPFEKPGFTGSFYFTITDADALWNEVKTKARIVYEPQTFEWGMREFAIRDNNGYMLQFGQDTEG